MTPYELSVLIHINTRVRGFEDSGIEDTPLLNETIERFILDEVVMSEPESTYGNLFKLTEFGRCWLESILSTPKPRRAYVDYQDNIIKIIEE